MKNKQENMNTNTFEIKSMKNIIQHGIQIS